MNNRLEWQSRGQQCVTEMKARAIEKYLMIKKVQI
jgi:hypothetical protein